MSRLNDVLRVDVLRVNAIIMIFLAIVLAGCTASNTNTFNRYVGTDGITISFMKDAPAASVYENRPFPVRVQIQNKGAQDVNYSDVRVTFTDDPLYITGGLLVYDFRNYDQESTSIQGKSLYYQQGETKEVGIPGDVAFSTKPVLGQRSSPTTDLIASVCYVYRTTFTSDVCIDTSLYTQNVRAQSCKQKDIALTGGQGSPIAITKVAVVAIPIYDSRTKVNAVRPEFHIDLQNSGGGYLIGPNTLPLESACLLKGITSDQINSVNVEAWLLNTKLSCGADITQNNGILQLSNNAGSIVCTVPEDQMSQAIYSATQNFQTVLTINVSYIYKSSIKQTIAITRTPGNVEPTYPLWMYGKLSGYMYLSDVKGAGLPAGFSEGPTPDLPPGTIADASGNAPKAETPIYNQNNLQATKCEYYAKDPSQAPTGAKQITSGFQCACSRDQCLSSGSKCIFGFCPGESYCCTIGTIQTYTGGVAFTGNIQTSDPTVNSAIKNINKFDGLMGAIFDAANKEGVDPKLLVAQITAESGGRTTTIGTSGEAGISQFMYATASSSQFKDIFGDGLKICVNSASSPDAGNCAGDPRFDPYKSVKAEARYMKSNLDKFNNDPKLALAAYNCGEGCMSGAIQSAGSSDWSVVSTKLKTGPRDYALRIMNYYNSITVTS